MITNGTNPPNGFLKCYRVLTMAFDSNQFFWLQKYQNTYSAFNDYSFTGGNTFDNVQQPGYVLGNFISSLLNGTKKAVFKLNKHPLAPVQEYIACYGFGDDTTAPPSSNPTPLPLNGIAKDGDEFEIYGISEIKKFYAVPNPSSPVPFYLTMTLFK